MNKRTSCAAFAALLFGSAAFAQTAFADPMTRWVRAGGAAHLIDVWN